MPLENSWFSYVAVVSVAWKINKNIGLCSLRKRTARMPTHKKDRLVFFFSELKRLFGPGIFRKTIKFPLCCYQEFRNSATCTRRGPICRIYRRHFYKNLATASAHYSTNYPKFVPFSTQSLMLCLSHLYSFSY